MTEHRDLQIVDSGADLFGGIGGALLLAVVGIDSHRHLRRSVSGEILHLLDVKPLFKQLRDVGMTELVRVGLTVLRTSAP